MKNTLSFLFIFACSFCTICAQTGKINGSVTNTSNQPLAYINVMLSGTNQGAITTDNGKYTIEKVNPGKYTLVFSSVGYGTLKKDVLVTAGKSSYINVKLKEQQQQLSEVVLEGHQNKYVSREPSTSLRLKTEIAKLPQNIQVIGGELFQDQQVTSIMDGITRNVSGVTLLEHWGNFARVNMRGFRLPAFRNGVNVQDTWGPLSEDMNTVERIEFVKGPAGFMMSAGEPGGFYNVVTKKPTETFIANASFTSGSFDFYRGTVDVGGKLTGNGKLLGRFNAMYQTTDTHRGNEKVQRFNIAPSLTYKLSDRTSFTGEMNLQQAESYLGSAYVFAPASAGYGSLDQNFKFTNDDYPVTDIQEVTFFLNAKHKLTENWSVEGQLGFLRYDQVGNSTWLWGAIQDNGDAVRYTSKWDALSRGKYGQIYIYGNFDTGGISHKVMGGFDFSDKTYWTDWNELSIVDTTTPFNIYNPVYGESPATNFDRSVPVQYRNGGKPYSATTNRSYYLQDEIGFLENKIRLTLAGRYTNLTTLDYEDNDEVFTPRLGLSVDVLPTLTFYALYDQSFIAQAGTGSLDPTNPASDGFAIRDPLEATDVEGGIKKSFLDNRLKASLGAFLITKKNLITGIGGTNFSYLQDEVQSKGIEFDLQGEITPQLNLVLNYANTNVEITEDSNNPDNVGNRLAGHAKHITNGWVNYSFAPKSYLKGFGASLGYQYQVDRSSWALGADGESVLPDYFRMDGALSWKNDHFRVQLNVNNLLDKYLYSGGDYGYLYWQSEPGMNGRLGVTYTF